MTLHLVPITLREARAYVGKMHRHCLPPQGGLCAVAVADDDGAIRGVGILGRPVARALQDGVTAEVARIATDGTPNACSMLYGSLRRVAVALGYQNVYTYCLASEPGTSLRAAGFVRDADIPARAAWTPAEGVARYQRDIFGAERRPPEAKVRWIWRRVA